MITDAFLAASESEFRITATSEDGTCREFTLGEAASDCGAFTQLRDGLLLKSLKNIERLELAKASWKLFQVQWLGQAIELNKLCKRITQELSSKQKQLNN